MIFNYNKKMCLALFYMSLLSIVNISFDYTFAGTSIVVGLSTFIWQAFNAWFVVWLLDLMCRADVGINGGGVKSCNFTAWGYFWRGSVALSFFIPVWVLVNLIFPLDLSSMSISTMLLMEPLILISCLLAIWVCFSKSRVSQFKYLVNIFRGY